MLKNDVLVRSALVMNVKNMLQIISGSRLYGNMKKLICCGTEYVVACSSFLEF
jgi:hypothetical protein